MKVSLKKNVAFGTSVIILSIVLLLIVVAAVASFVYLSAYAKYDKDYIRLAGEQRILALRLTSSANEAIHGNIPAFRILQQSRKEFETNLDHLINGDPASGLPPSPRSLKDKLDDMKKLWTLLDKNTDALLKAETTIQEFNDFYRKIAQSLPALMSLNEQLNISLATSNDSTVAQIYLASQQQSLLSRLTFSAEKLLLDEKNTQKNLDQFNSDLTQFSRALNALQTGNREMNINRVTSPQAQAKLTELIEIYNNVSGISAKAFEQASALVKAQQAAINLATSSNDLIAISNALMNNYSTLVETRAVRDYTGLSLGAAALLIIVWLGIKIQGETKRRLEATAQQNQRNQEAIMRLLDEIVDLADGDLTATATVSEDITGAIADAINYTVEQLRTLVSSINEVTVQVSSSAKSTQATALHLAEASGQQAKQIRAASDAINQMAASIDTVSDNAYQSSAVANQSLDIAKKGSGAVQDTIRGMDTIREQIQETSKRIKRLGESSQEIGDMVELINDIADQTNILALNAAIQAAMAGKSGRGFAVVADEVQRLAEKSTDATMQIENLVRTIQSDTNEAVASMEQSISQVVSGAKLALNAGEALSEIENVTAQLAELIHSISKSAQQQSATASKISESMNVIQNVTSQTAAGTTTTSNSIGMLAELSNQLRKSVAGFKLPGK